MDKDIGIFVMIAKNGMRRIKMSNTSHTACDFCDAEVIGGRKTLPYYLERNLVLDCYMPYDFCNMECMKKFIEKIYILNNRRVSECLTEKNIPVTNAGWFSKIKKIFRLN